MERLIVVNGFPNPTNAPAAAPKTAPKKRQLMNINSFPKITESNKLGSRNSSVVKNTAKAYIIVIPKMDPNRAPFPI